MAVVVLQEFPPGDGSTTGYDAVTARLNAHADPPDGLIVHTAGFDGEGRFRIIDVWESREHHERFMADRLGPLIEEIILPAGGPPPQQEALYELHDMVRP